MAQFKGVMRSSRGNDTTKLGQKDGGLTAIVNGWDIGVRVEAYCDEESGKDCFNIYQTGGSNEKIPEELITTIEK